MFTKGLSKLHSYVFGNSGGEPSRIILIGLDAGGKTTFLYKARQMHSSIFPSEIETTIPTIGFNVETLVSRNVDVKCWDIGGCDKIRPLWRHYTMDAAALVLFVDSNDKERLPDAKNELDTFLNDESLRGVPLLVVANKQDLPYALCPQEVAQRLELPSIVDRDWEILPASVSSGEGVRETIAWIKAAAKRPPREAAIPAGQSVAGASGSSVSGNLIHSKPSAEVPQTDKLPASQLDLPAPPSISVSSPAVNPPATELSWTDRTDIPEDEFLAMLDSYQLDIWDHYTHVRIAWVLINKYGIEDGFNRVEEAIRNFIVHSARTDSRSFHATMTRFWCHMIAYAMELSSWRLDPDHTKSLTFKDFIVDVCDANSSTGKEVPLWDKTLFKKFYASSAMFRSEARAVAGSPDLYALPDIVPVFRCKDVERMAKDVAYLENSAYWRLSS